MPVMDGWEFLRRYRAISGPQAPVMICAATREFAESAIQLGGCCFLEKPFDLDELLRTVAHCLEHQPASP